MRVAAPFIEGGFVVTGGAVCLELLTAGGWSQAYMMESVIMQIMASMAKVGLVQWVFG